MEKPKGLDKTRLRLQAKLPKSMHVGTGYGIEHLGESAGKWRLYVYTDDKDKSMIPAEFEGYPVSIRGIPKAL